MNSTSSSGSGDPVDGNSNAADPIRITAVSLTPTAFKAFGEVVGPSPADEGGRAINQQTSRRFDDVLTLDLLRQGGSPRASLVRARPAPLPVRLRLLEMHPLGSQLFLPLGFARFLVVVAIYPEPRGSDDLRAFVTNGRQGINYRAGVWHHPLLAIDQETDFLVIDRSPESDNCQELLLTRAIQVTLDGSV